MDQEKATGGCAGLSFAGEGGGLRAPPSSHGRLHKGPKGPERHTAIAGRPRDWLGYNKSRETGPHSKLRLDRAKARAFADRERTDAIAK